MSTGTDPESLGYDLLPPDPGLVSPDLALEAALAPVVDLQPPDVLPYGRGVAFDFTKGEFVMHGSSPAVVYDTDHLQVWIEKTLHTAKYAHPIYSDDYGMEDPFILVGKPLDAASVGDWEQQVVDALTVHDRILDATNFSYQQTGNLLNVSFEVTLDGSDQEVLPVAVTFGGSE